MLPTQVRTLTFLKNVISFAGILLSFLLSTQVSLPYKGAGGMSLLCNISTVSHFVLMLCLSSYIVLESLSFKTLLRSRG
jgi:hypothetical protein